MTLCTVSARAAQKDKLQSDLCVLVLYDQGRRVGKRGAKQKRKEPTLGWGGGRGSWPSWPLLGVKQD